ncbi:hypothetical protein UFOVP9_23 [uncultured Caudovirales phage]|jgi:hypothetical protein|uniref:Uncharacterized protein n=1 Tax=uncultured Caudovirales phage TaxID=2100421 RepID=A0A6J5KGR8_9CAUD|nr:hypothetical protein UFOVP9_23 [uncultured Caudovirales phage]
MSDEKVKKFKSTLKDLSQKENKSLFNTLSFLMDVIGEMQSSRLRMMEEVEKEDNTNSESQGILNVKVDLEFACRRLEYLSRRSHTLILKHKSLENIYGWYDVSEESRDFYQEFYMDTIERTHMELAMIINGFLDYDPFYFRKS